MLQSKPVAGGGGRANGPSEDVAPLRGIGAGPASANSRDTIRSIQARAQSISTAFAKLCR